MVFIVDSKTTKRVLDFEAVDESICVLRTTFFNISFINPHAPTEEKSQLEKETFYCKLDVVQRDTRKLGVRGWRRQAIHREEWSHLVKEAKVQKGL